jgi:hypothetical protein
VAADAGGAVPRLREGRLLQLRHALLGESQESFKTPKVVLLDAFWFMFIGIRDSHKKKTKPSKIQIPFSIYNWGF